jgi:predicted nucleic acid-binding Zn ribbon protein
MPVYGYKCECGESKDVIKRLCEYNTEELCKCGKVMTKEITAPTIAGMNNLGQSINTDKN